MMTTAREAELTYASPSSVRFQIYALLILVSCGTMFGRVIGVDNVSDRAVQEYRVRLIPGELARRRAQLERKGLSDAEIEKELARTARALLTDAKKERPTLSANDRSRFLTIRALVEPGARVWRYLPCDEHGRLKERYEPGEVLRNCSCPCSQQFNKSNAGNRRYIKQWVPLAIDKAMETPGWDTIDMVKHGMPREPFDPSDPLSGYLYSSKPTLLPVLMAIPCAVVSRCFGISLRTEPFAAVRITLIVCNMIPLVLAFFAMAFLIDRVGRTDWSRYFAVATLCFATFVTTFATTLNNHVPCVVCEVFAIYGAFRVCFDGDTRRRWFLLTGFFGALAVACELPALAIAFVLLVMFFVHAPKKTVLFAIPCGMLVVAGFFGTNYLAHHTLKPAYAMKRDHMALAREEARANPERAKEFPALVTSFDPNDWYIYNYIPSARAREPKNARLSYWANRSGIDRGEPSRLVYLFHATVGHHGLFSLTPVWLLSMLGLAMWLVRGTEDRRLRRFAAATALLTVLFFAFYLTRDEGDRNYGGMTCGLRWFFPLIPLWLLAMLPALDALAPKRLGRAVALGLIALSVASACYPQWNPWSFPWLYNLFLEYGWI